MLHDSKIQLIQFTDWESGWKSPLNDLQANKENEKSFGESEMNFP